MAPDTGPVESGGMIYLDYQATTPVAPEVAEAMRPWAEEKYANPHSPSRWGREAAAAIEVARGQVERAIGLTGGSLAFTGSATEAINWAIRGTLEKAPKERNRIVTIATEHAAVLDTAEWLAGQGIDLTLLPVGRDGLIELADLERELDERVALVAAMLVNNEIGVIQPVGEIARMAHDAGALMLCDAVQGLGRIAIPDGPDMVAVSAHKIHGPKGIGALWMRDGAGPVRRLRGGCEAGVGAPRSRPRPCRAAVDGRRGRAGRGLDGERQRRDPLSRQSQHPPRGTGFGAPACRPARHRFLAGQRLRKRLGPAEPRAPRPWPQRPRGAIVDPHRLRPLHERAGTGRRAFQDRGSRPIAAGPRHVTRVRFLRANGTVDEVVATPGQRLLDVAWAAGEPLEGSCEGVMACSTCHVIVDKGDFEKLPPASEEEEDLLDLAAHATRTSRLACQIMLTADLDSLSVRIPAGWRNWQNR